jgi:hypothetical protein
MKVIKAPINVIIIIISLVLLFLLISPDISYSQSQYIKDPQLALVLSVIDPAFGLFYAGEPNMGIFYWAIDKAAFLSTMFILFDIRISFPPDIGFYIELKLRDMDFVRILSATLIGSFFIGFRIFSIFDARNKTLEYNRKLLNNKIYILNFNSSTDLFISVDKIFGIGFRFNF